MDPIRGQDVELVASGVAMGGLVVAAWSIAARRTTAVTAAVSVAAALVAAEVAADLPGIDQAEGNPWGFAVGLSVLIAASVMAFAREHHPAATWLPTAVLAAAVASWAAVPETSWVLTVGGAVAAVAAMAFVRGTSVTVGTSVVLAVAVLVVSVAASHPSDLQRAGVAACSGMLLWWPAGRLVRAAAERARRLPGPAVGPWLLVAHLALAFLAARWVGVAADATWGRLVIIGLLGTAVAALCRPRATMDA